MGSEGKAGSDAAAIAAALCARTPTVLRALTSRLGEVRDVAAAFSSGASAGVPERAFLRALRRVRDECHEWTAGDVLRALHAGGDAGTLLVAPRRGSGGGARAVPLRHGLPAWSWPAYPRAPWARLLCPVLEALLCSCYEDWLEVGTAAASALLGALAPLVELAQDCRAEDLEEEWEEEEGGEREEEEQHQHQHQQRAMRHAAASGAVDFARAAGPLVAALTCAAQCPNAATQKRAGEVCSRLRQALHACAHLGQRQ